MEDQKKTKGQPQVGSDALLAAIVSSLEEKRDFCSVMEVIAAEETRWHDAATLRTQRAVWNRAATLAKEVAANIQALPEAGRNQAPTL